MADQLADAVSSAHPAFNLEEAIESILDAQEFVRQRLVNREEIIRQAFFALLTGEHLLLQSRTGAGKTLLAEQIFGMFHAARIFKVQASKEQQPDTYFGGLDIELLKTGKIFHNTEGSLVDCEFGFIDEIFDANDFTLRALLSLLNERALIRGVQNKAAVTHTVIASTNYLRVNEVTEAVLDRFLYKAVVLPDKNPFLQYKIAQRYLQHSGSIKQPAATVSFQTLQRLNAIVCGRDSEIQVAIDADLLYFANLVVRHYEYARNRILREVNRGSQGQADGDFYISPRTQAKAMDLLRCVALVNGRTTVLREDVRELSYIFTTTNVDEERQTYLKSYTSLVNTLSVSNGFEQLKVLLSFGVLLDDIRSDPSLLQRPLSELPQTPVRRTFMDWLKDSLSGSGGQDEQNKRLLSGFLKEFIPVCEEIRELKQNLEQELMDILR